MGGFSFILKEVYCQVLIQSKKIKMNKTVIASAFVLGAILAGLGYQTMIVYQLRNQVETDHTTLTQVVTFLNNVTQPPAPTPQAVQATTTPKKKK